VYLNLGTLEADFYCTSLLIATNLPHTLNQRKASSQKSRCRTLLAMVNPRPSLREPPNLARFLQVVTGDLWDEHG